ncbi:MAG: hypothetical protein ACLUE2_18550 [Bacteroides cellulosilyticus]
MKKETYVKPTVELISMENEGCVMTGSFTGGGQINPGARSGYGRSREEPTEEIQTLSVTWNN